VKVDDAVWKLIGARRMHIFRRHGQDFRLVGKSYETPGSRYEAYTHMSETMREIVKESRGPIQIIRIC
jgi:hypothetical protein